MDTMIRRTRETESRDNGFPDAHGRHESDRVSDRLLVATEIAKTYTHGCGHAGVH